MIRKPDNRRRKVLTETDDVVDTSLFDASFEDMKEQISAIQEQLQVTTANDTCIVIATAYSDMILLLLDKIYNEIL